MFLVLTINIFAKTDNYLKNTSLEKNRLLLTFKYNIEKVKPFTIKSNKKIKYVYDIKGGSLPSNKNISQYKHPSVRVFRIAQYSKNLLRIVIETGIKTKISFSVKGKKLRFFLPSKRVSCTPKIKKVVKKRAVKRVVKKRVKKPKRKRKITVILDAGHGGRDPGAIARGRQEKRITLAVVKKLRKKLQRRGYRVILTRRNDNYVSLRQRASIANRNGGKIFISLHVNAAPKRKARHTAYRGVEIFYLSLAKSKRVKNKRAYYKGKRIYSRSRYRAMTSFYKVSRARRLAKHVKREFLRSVRRKYSVTDKGLKRSDFWVLFETTMPSILVEMGYITNSYEGRRLTNSHYQNLIVNGIANGVDAYFRK